MDQGFEALYEAYFPRIYAFLLKLTEDRDLAEELTQETFYQAFVSFHRFRGESDVFTWLASIGKHTYYRHLRRSRHQTESLDAGKLAEMFEVAEPSEPPAETVERRLQAEAARRALEELPAKYRDVFILRVYAEMSYAQIGQALQISENSARVVYYRAKKMLMEAMKDGNDV